MTQDTKTPKREVLAALLKREVLVTRRERREERPVTSGPQILPGDD